MRWSDLPPAARLFRIAHAAWAVVSLVSLGRVWWSACTGRRDRALAASIAWLSLEGVALVIGGGDCPFGPAQARLGDPIPLFELVLPPRAAKAAVPVLTVVSLVGIILALVRSARRQPLSYRPGWRSPQRTGATRVRRLPPQARARSSSPAMRRFSSSMRKLCVAGDEPEAMTAQALRDATRRATGEERGAVEARVERSSCLAVRLGAPAEPVPDARTLRRGVKGHAAVGLRGGLERDVAGQRPGHTVDVGGTPRDHDVGPLHEAFVGILDRDHPDLTLGSKPVRYRVGDYVRVAKQRLV